MRYDVIVIDVHALVLKKLLVGKEVELAQAFAIFADANHY